MKSNEIAIQEFPNYRRLEKQILCLKIFLNFLQDLVDLLLYKGFEFPTGLYKAMGSLFSSRYV